MEIRFPTDDESPHYLSHFVLSRAGAAVLLEVTDMRNTQKCAALIPLEKFVEAAALLGAIKVVDIGDASAKPLGAREIDKLGF